MLPAIVLAAGRSSRFGGPKALASAGGATFISQILNRLHEAGVSDRIVVCREDDADLQSEVARAVPSARVVFNPAPDRGQLSSLLTGLEAIDRPGVIGVLVTLADMPLVSIPTIRRMVEAAASTTAVVVRASYGGRHGHPVIFKREAFQALRAADPVVGAKAVAHAMPTEDVDVDDPGVIEDVDTPADYDRLFGRNP